MFSVLDCVRVCRLLVLNANFIHSFNLHLCVFFFICVFNYDCCVFFFVYCGNMPGAMPLLSRKSRLPGLGCLIIYWRCKHTCYTSTFSFRLDSLLICFLMLHLCCVMFYILFILCVHGRYTGYVICA